jgi:hypothetical protein
MQSDETYRAFLLRMTDAETEDAVEQGILDGSVDPGYLHQIEEELIDDFLFGRLSTREKELFESEFLCSAERNEKLRLAAMLRSYSTRNSPQRGLYPLLQRLNRLGLMTWRYALPAMLACTLILVVWLGVDVRSLREELTQSSLDDKASRQEIASLRQEQQTLHAPASSMTSDQMEMLGIRLSGGVDRGMTAVSVLHLDKQATMARIELELSFEPYGRLEEKLLDTQDKVIWSQRFSDSGPVALRGVTTVVVPTALLVPGDYRLQVVTQTRQGGSESLTYLFRVRND